MSILISKFYIFMIKITFIEIELIIIKKLLAKPKFIVIVLKLHRNSFLIITPPNAEIFIFLSVFFDRINEFSYRYHQQNVSENYNQMKQSRLRIFLRWIISIYQHGSCSIRISLQNNTNYLLALILKNLAISLGT